MLAKASRAPSPGDRISLPSFDEACKVLGRDGKRLLIRGGSLDASTDVHLDDDEARMQWAPGLRSRIFFDATRGRLGAACSTCSQPCVHVAGLLSILLEQKTDLGLAAPPPEIDRPDSERHLMAKA